MTVLEHRSLTVESRGVDSRGVDAPTVLDTTELRWFVPGLLPAEVGEWFGATAGALEERCDTYQLRGRGDIGVKRRFRTTIELKVRQSLPVPMQLGSVTGSLEQWRRWSPAGRLVDDRVEGPWVDVRKSIVKRRFSIDGTEVAHAPMAPTAGCDVEVAAVNVGAVRAWTVALSAVGPHHTRQDSVLASWRTLMPRASGPASSCLLGRRSMGYPEWLASLDPRV